MLVIREIEACNPLQKMGTIGQNGQNWTQLTRLDNMDKIIHYGTKWTDGRMDKMDKTGQN